MRKRMVLGGAVKAIREAKAESSEQYRLGRFAATCLISSAYLCNIEAERKFPTDEVIHRIATHLGVPVGAISYELPLEAVA